jgi:tetratricopeptide (TPR) repeat protein
MIAELAAAEALLSVGRPEQARQRISDYLAGHPDDARALRLVARCHEATDEYPQMLAAARAAVAAEAHSYPGHILLTSALIHMNRHADAVGAAEVAIRLHPHGWRGHLLSGVAQCALGRRRTGMAAIGQAVTLAPEEPHVHYVQGLLRHSTGNRLAARRAYRWALRLDPQHAGAQRGLGQLALAAGRLGDAVAHFSGAAAVEPGSPGASAGLVRAFLGLTGTGLIVGWTLMFVLVFGMYPLAWALAGVLAAGYAAWVARFWRRLPTGGRLLLRTGLRTDPRLYVRVLAGLACAAGALVLGAVDAGIDPDDPRADVLPQLGVVGAAFLLAVGAVLIAHRVGGRPGAALDEAAGAPPDAPLQLASARLALRLLGAAWAPATLLGLLALGQAPWLPRAATGSMLIVGYGWVAVRVRAGVLRDPGSPGPVLARLLGPLALGTGTLTIFLPVAAYWPGDVPLPATVAAFLVIAVVLLAWLCWLPVQAARRYRRRLRSAAGRPAP